MGRFNPLDKLTAFLRQVRAFGVDEQIVGLVNQHNARVQRVLGRTADSSGVLDERMAVVSDLTSAGAVDGEGSERRGQVPGLSCPVQPRFHVETVPGFLLRKAVQSFTRSALINILVDLLAVRVRTRPLPEILLVVLKQRHGVAAPVLAAEPVLQVVLVARRVDQNLVVEIAGHCRVGEDQHFGS